MQELAASIPSRFALSDWRLLYSTHVHGISLNTLYLRCSWCKVPFALLEDYHAPAWWLKGLRPPLHTPERRLRSLEACRGLRSSPRPAPRMASPHFAATAGAPQAAARSSSRSETAKAPQLVERGRPPCPRTAPRRPPWTTRRRRPLLSTPERSLSSLDDCGGLSSPPQTAPKFEESAPSTGRRRLRRLLHRVEAAAPSRHLLRRRRVLRLPGA